MPRENKGPHLWRDPDTGIWQVRSYDTGRRKLRSTGHRDRTSAEAVLARALLEMQRPALPPEPSVADVLAAYAAARTETHGYRQLEGRCRVVARMIGGMKPSDIKAANIRDYIERRKPDVKPGTIREELSKLRAALRWADSEGLIPTPRPIRIPISGTPRSRWLTRDEVDRLISAAVETHVCTYLMLALHTGARSSAILELPWSGVDLDRGVVVFPRKAGGKNRVAVPINEDLDAELRIAKRRRTTDYVVEWAGKRVNNPRTGWLNALTKSGIAHCTPHDLRRTAGSLMLQAGVHIDIVAAVLGHRDSGITRRVYAHLDVEHLRPAVDALARNRNSGARTLRVVSSR